MQPGRGRRCATLSDHLKERGLLLLCLPSRLQDAHSKELDLRAPVAKQRAKRFNLEEELRVRAGACQEVMLGIQYRSLPSQHCPATLLPLPPPLPIRFHAAAQGRGGPVRLRKQAGAAHLPSARGGRLMQRGGAAVKF